MAFIYTGTQLELGSGPVWSLVLALATPFILTWLITYLQSQRALVVARNAASGEKRPPTLPRAIPFIGHILSFLRNRHLFLANASHYFGRGIPSGVYLATFPAYIVSGKEAVAEFLKDPARSLSLTDRSLKYMKHAFGCPEDVVDAFSPRSDLAIENEIHSALQTMFAGPRLEILAKRYQAYVVEQVKLTDIGDEWVELPDLCVFMQKRVFEGAIRAVFGTELPRFHPTIATDFFEFNRYVKTMFMGVPKWASPKANAARDVMTDGLQRWQKSAAESINIDEIPDDVEWEPVYGSKSTRVRQKLMTKRNIVHPAARSAENLGFIWATNANSIPAANWFILETLHDPKLEQRVRECLAAARLPPQEGPTGEKQDLVFDIGKLTNDDLLQSIYAEVLRLRVAAMIVRKPTTPKFSLGGWHIKTEETVTLSTRTEHMDTSFWNSEGPQGKPKHPLDRFWAERFLVYPDDPKSGPLKDPKRKRQPASTSGDKNAPYFSMDGCTWNWIPFGGGRHLCPGRHFAKREIMLAAAIFLTTYDIELKKDKLPGPDESCFGFGTMPPAGKVPCRIRRRRG